MSISKIIKKLAINLGIMFIFGLIASYIGPNRGVFIKIFIGFTLAAIILGNYMINAWKELFKWIDNYFDVEM